MGKTVTSLATTLSRGQQALRAGPGHPAIQSRQPPDSNQSVAEVHISPRQLLQQQRA